jgi:hypothetical protein
MKSQATRFEDRDCTGLRPPQLSVGPDACHSGRDPLHATICKGQRALIVCEPPEELSAEEEANLPPMLRRVKY